MEKFGISVPGPELVKGMIRFPGGPYLICKLVAEFLDEIPKSSAAGVAG